MDKSGFAVNTLILSVAILAVLLFAANQGMQVYKERQSAQQSGITVMRDDVLVTAVVSGKVSVQNMARLSFPTTGTISNLLKKEGDFVEQGEVIASLIQDTQLAEYSAALHNLEYQESLKDELIRGPEAETRQVSRTSVSIAAENLTQTEAEYSQIVKNAYEKLLSSDLMVVPVDFDNADTPPQITGNYRCDTGGTYNLSVYRSSSPTDISYRVTGLEEGVTVAWTGTPAPLGSCGLHIQFDEETRYSNDEWTISVPNTRGASYLTNLNAHKLAVEQKEKAVSQASLALELARDVEAEGNARPSTEALAQVDALIEQARASMLAQEAKISNFIIKAPFSGVVTDIDMKIGETTDNTKSISIINEGGYELEVKIPEVDIRSIKVGNRVEARFDASPNEVVPASIEFISPLSEMIEGVAYYEARLTLPKRVAWLKEGMNADVTIFIDTREDVLVVPKQYLFTEGAQTFVYIKNGADIVKTKVTVGLVGNNGLVEVVGATEGASLVLP